MTAARANQVDGHGSFLITSPRWSVLNARGSLQERQDTARRHRVTCYAEQHLNAIGGANAGQTNYAMAIAPVGASPKTIAWARDYTRRSAKAFGIKDSGVLCGGRGSGNVSRVLAPAILLEPMFLTSNDFKHFLASGEIIDALAGILADSIVEHFGPTGLVGLSVGHMYRGTGDKGAHRPQPDPDELLDPAFDQEAEICDSVVNIATEILTQ